LSIYSEQFAGEDSRMKSAWIRTVGVALLFLTAAESSVAQSDATKTAPHKTRNVVLIVADGLRWQEIFTGADASLMNAKDGDIWDKPEDLRREFWREDVAERRAALFPFLWGTVARQG
jgi:hypothetical protein